MIRKKHSIVLVAATVTLMIGCASSMEVKQSLKIPSALGSERIIYRIQSVTASTSDAPEEFLQLLKEQLTSQLSEVGLLGKDNAQSSTGTVNVVVKKYRMRGEAMRQLVGFLFSGERTIGVRSQLFLILEKTLL